MGRGSRLRARRTSSRAGEEGPARSLYGRAVTERMIEATQAVRSAATRHWQVLIPCLLLAIVLTGCGGTDHAAALTRPASTTSAAATPSPTTTTPPEQTANNHGDTTAEPTSAKATPSPETTTHSHTVTVSVTTTVAEASPPATPAATTTTGVSAAGVAAAGAAVAAQSEENTEEGTPWGWIAFGLLAASVIVGAVVWRVRSRHSHNGGSTPAAT